MEMIDIRIRIDYGKIEETRNLDGEVSINDIALALMQLKQMELWLLEHAENDYDVEMKIK